LWIRSLKVAETYLIRERNAQEEQLNLACVGSRKKIIKQNAQEELKYIFIFKVKVEGNNFVIKLHFRLAKGLLKS
jgi:hypothetical protein